MSNQAIASLDSLISGLESELASDPRFKLLQDLKKARADYDKTAEAGEEEVSPNARIAAPIAGGRQMTPARAKAFELAQTHLSGRTEPVKTKVLFEMLDAQGVDLPGGMNNLASLLGRFPKIFKSHGRAGWTLIDSARTSNGSGKPEAADDLLSRSASAASNPSPPDQRTSQAGP
jgi:hypothetical protein